MGVEVLPNIVMVAPVREEPGIVNKRGWEEPSVPARLVTEANVGI